MIFKFIRMLRKRTVKQRLPVHVTRMGNIIHPDALTLEDEIVFKSGKVRDQQTIARLAQERQVSRIELARQLRKDKKRIAYWSRFKTWVYRALGTSPHPPKPDFTRKY